MDIPNHSLVVQPPPAMRKKKRRKQVPEVLWRLFRHRARPLCDTILALIPPNCCCSCSSSNSAECLSCKRDEALLLLLRPSDPPGYRRLLNGCFAVVPEDAPPLSAFDPRHFQLQRENVKRCIETIMCEQSSSSSLICCRYDKDSCSNSVVDELSSSNWNLLSMRVGDALIIYLFKYASLFLPLPRGKHIQITGYPISDLYFKSAYHMPNPKTLHLPMHKGSGKKKRIVEVVSIEGNQPSTCCLGVEPFLNPAELVANNGSRHFGSEGLSHNVCERSSKNGILPFQKRKRLFRWQRQRKRRQLIDKNANSLIQNGGKSCNSDTSSRLPQNILCSSDKSVCLKIDCFCCSIFQNVPRMSKNAEIDRKKLFYRFDNSTSMFPKKHTLSTLKPNSYGASVLFNNIFGTFVFDKNPGTKPCSHNQSSGLVLSTCLYHCLTKLLKRLIRMARNCPHMRLLKKHCSIASSIHGSSSTIANHIEENDCQTELLLSRKDWVQIDKKLFNPRHPKNHASESAADLFEPCPKKQVVSFIWAICRRIVPPPLLGEPSNWRILRKNISKFIHLRKFEKFSLKECIHKLKLSKFPFLSNKQSRCRDNECSGPCITDASRHAILECWLFWLFAHLVSPLVQANFYVTDSENGRQDVVYYQKSTWKKLMKEAECMKKKMFRLMTHAYARKILGKRPFGYSRARLLPKQSGFRLLANLQAPSRLPLKLPAGTQISRKFQGEMFHNPMRYQNFKSVNQVLNDVHVVLKGLFTEMSGKLGSSVFDYNDVYRKLVPFLLLLKDSSVTMPNIFIVVADVSKAFDSITHDKLLSVMKDVILDDEYALEKLTHVICTKNSLKVHKHLNLVNQYITSGSTQITSLPLGQSLGGVLVKKELDRKLSKENIISLLKEHITRNVVQLDNHFYLQRVGIPQGSVLSTILCAFYYEHMERNVIYPYLAKVNKAGFGESHVSASLAENHTKEMIVSGLQQQQLLLRFIDDYLFISTSRTQASMFFTRLDRGFHEYNCSMNKDKFGLNFDVENRQNTSKRLFVGKDGVSFLCWSGLLVNCSTLEIQADYTRYLDIHLSSTLTVSRQGKIGCQLKKKLRSYLLTKCHPIFYDSNINSLNTVCLNIYQAFLVCAMKFVCYISELSIISKFSPEFYFNAITASLS
ncbi:telomerase reverse transcriptase isoform X2 [Andrographis paniculata]|uniref:telomerase reverse transcriptase isoform X2 n=1 Tax=Andrographis paniculata TaxID=175694 RepID=UPI0021E78534|nr:telomerase reverse transcriptase isoform X2 [Andrographis paniculata]